MRNNNRLFISALITLAVMIGWSFTIGDPQQAHSTRIVGVIVAIVIASNAIYNIDKWSLFRRTVVHSLLAAVVILPSLALSGWFNLTSAFGIIILIVTYVSFGVIGWVVGYLVNKQAMTDKTSA